MMEEIKSYGVKLDRELTLTDVGILLREIIIELKQIRQIQEDAWKLDGTSMTNNFFIPQGSGVVKIDFVEGKHSVGGVPGTPKQTSFEIPMTPVQQIKISNLGPADLYYSTNKFLNQLEASSKLLAGEGTGWLIFPKRSIRQVNLATQGQGGVSVRVEMLM